jgi:peptide-methionine (S)-S-oxide reductase
MSQHSTPEKEIATLGGGCFWCLDPIFDELRGVEGVVVGYAGGKVANPSYKLVCTGTSGHAEVVKIAFNPQIISYKELLKIFFSVHDPTTPNRQGADVGPQYRSIILYHDEAQKATAEVVIQEFETEGIWDAPIVTELAPFSTFYEAEDYHQKYFEKNPGQGYCRVVIAPKVAKFRKKYQQKLQQ